MDLWIRNSEKTLLLKANEVIVRPIATSSGKHGQIMCRDLFDYDSDLNNNEKLQFAVYVNDLDCGIYSTKEKALKVLDEIQDSMYDVYETMGRDGNVYVRHIQPKQDNFIVYQMPQDNEVEV